jgi:hypothetical protein
MENKQIFIVILIIVLVLFYAYKMYERFVPGSYDITPSITANMDWKGATLSKIPYYTNNLQQVPSNDLDKVRYLQGYQPNIDGPTDSTYVSDGMEIPTNLNDPNSPNQLEGFTMMNPYVSQ